MGASQEPGQLEATEGGRGCGRSQRERTWSLHLTKQQRLESCITSNTMLPGERSGMYSLPHTLALHWAWASQLQKPSPR